MNDFEQSLGDIEFISLDSIEIDVTKLESSKVVLNGFFPQLIERIINKTNLQILFLNSNYVHLAHQNWPGSRDRFEVFEISLECQTPTGDEFDAVIYEGNVNFFSGLDLSSFLMKSVYESGLVSRAYFICHHETRLNPPIRYSDDFDQHLHESRISWEEFFTNCTNWVPRKNILTGEESKRVKFKNPLIINCSVSYHQPVWSLTTNLLSKGARGFFSDRNTHPSLFSSSNSFEFVGERLLNYSPFEPESVFSMSIKKKLKKQLGEYLNVDLD